MKIYFERSGGFLGRSVSTFVDTNQIPPEQALNLLVKVEDADVTDEIFTRLMGDVVEPRRDFIQENALNVANLDV